MNNLDFTKELFTEDEELQHQIEVVFSEIVLIQILESMPIYICILNNKRQIVYANESFSKLTALEPNSIISKKPGDALGCINAIGSRNGCGTTVFCRQCGANHAIIKSLNFEKGRQECRINTKNNDALDLLVWATPIELQGYHLTIFALSDISHEKRRKALERIFFHDILNTAGGIWGFVDMLEDSEENELKENIKTTKILTEKLIDEIKAQRTLSAAENDELELNLTAFSSREILEELLMLYLKHEVTENKEIKINPGSIDLIIYSDKTVLRRILGNLLKNALEATRPGEVVNIWCEANNGFVEFKIENPSFIPLEVQMQIFQRSFSTKGSGRGLGTYSVKLLTERYLHGKVNFISSPEKGTTFSAIYPVRLEQ